MTPFTPEAQNEPKYMGGQNPLSSFLRPSGNKLSTGMNKQHPNTLLPQKSIEKMQKHCRHCQNALRRFLAMSAMIGCNYAPDSDGAHPMESNRTPWKVSRL